MTRTDYWTCPYCGANLDPDERCDCKGGEIVKDVIYTDGKADYFVREGLSSNDQKNHHVFKQIHGFGAHGYRSPKNPWTNKEEADKNLEILAKQHGWTKKGW